jgi:hypothetical protein
MAMSGLRGRPPPCNQTLGSIQDILIVDVELDLHAFLKPHMTEEVHRCLEFGSRHRLSWVAANTTVHSAELPAGGA